MKTTTHKLSTRTVTYTAEQKALDIASLLMKGFTKKEAEALINDFK